jgi:hypothetical protein
MRHRRFFSAMLTGVLLLSAAARADEPPMESLTEPEMDAGSLMSEFGQDHDGARRRYAGTTFLLQGHVIESAATKGADGRVHVHLKLGSQIGGDNLLPIWIDFDSKLADQVTPLGAGDPASIEVAYCPTKTTAKDDHELHGFLGLKIVAAIASQGSRISPEPSVASASPPVVATPDAPKPLRAVPDPDSSLFKPPATTHPPTATPPAPADNDNQPADSVREQAVSWIRTHTGFPPKADGSDPRIVDDMARHIDEALGADKDIQILFSPQTMKAKQAEALCIQDGCLVIVDFTPEEFAATGVKPGGVTVQLDHNFGTRGELNVGINKIQLDGNGTWDVTQPIKASLSLKLPADLDVNTVWLQAVFLLSTGRTSVAIKIKPDADGNCDFDIKPHDKFTQDVVRAKSSGPQVAMFEVIRIHKGDDGKPTVEIISKPKGLVLQLSASGADGNRP